MGWRVNGRRRDGTRKRLVEGACGFPGNQVIWDWRTDSMVFVCGEADVMHGRFGGLWNRDGELDHGGRGEELLVGGGRGLRRARVAHTDL